MSARILLLYSGGLDSLLAAKVLLEAGAQVAAVHFITPFTGSLQELPGEQYLGEWGIELRRVKIDLAGFRPLLENPPHGFGRALNPCIDCKILFLRSAKEIAESEGFDAVATGEVLGERPMSQNRLSLDIIERESGLEGLLLRPLSAKLLPPTEVEKKGLLDRSRLSDIQGRGRKTQLAMAKKWGITDYATPAGGCLLTEPLYCSKLRDLLQHRAATEGAVGLLKTGRHFRYPQGPKLIVGRNEQENQILTDHACADRILLEVKYSGSPIGLLFCLDPPSGVLDWAASVVARYCDDDSERIVVSWWRKYGSERKVRVKPASDKELGLWRV